MTCPVCGRYAEPDRETGYDSDSTCSQCLRIMAEEDDKLDPIESDLHDLCSVLASLADLVKDCHDPAKLFDVYVELGKLSRACTELQDAVGEIQLKVARQ